MTISPCVIFGSLGSAVSSFSSRTQSDARRDDFSACSGVSKKLIERYALRSPRDLTQLNWYVGFGFFKLAVVAEGIHHRFLAGKTVGEGFSHFGDAVPALLGAALQRLEK